MSPPALEALNKSNRMFAIGNDELKEKKPIGKTTKCPHCGKIRKVRYGTVKGKECRMLGFVNCGKESYLVAVTGKKLSND
jgi:hypothetical protein